MGFPLIFARFRPPRRLTTDVVYTFVWLPGGKEFKVKLEKVTKKGYNFVDIKTKLPMLKSNLYPITKEEKLKTIKGYKEGELWFFTINTYEVLIKS